MLALTGMMLKFSDMAWARFLVKFFGGAEGAGLIHRFGAILTFGYFGYHLYSLFSEKRKLNKSVKDYFFGPNSLMFNKKDIKDFVASVKWFFGKGERPKYGRWTYWEKFDYMAVFWGVAVIGFSGLMLWFPEFFSRLFPGKFINVAQIIHSDEALLAVGFIFTIHFFNTHLRPESFPMDTVIFTGHAPAEEYKEDRPGEYEELEAKGELEKKIAHRQFSKLRMQVIRFFGFLFLATGVLLVILIIFSLLFG
jgi:cytochrome b subunit of formate dehydrogenase